MNELLLSFFEEPTPLYAPSTAPFWDDEHISMGMLEAHLAPCVDAASRRYDFILRSTEWIGTLCAPCQGKRLVDLGCGPGIYAELFDKAGFRVTGIDLSRRSIDYARAHAAESGRVIEYIRQSYLELDREAEFDVATLIYCDYGVLSPADRSELLRRTYRALKPGGMFILDGWTIRYLDGYTEGRTVSFSDGGFWSPEKHLCIETNRLYPETGNYLDQYVIITKDACERYNTWNQIFTPETLGGELAEAGFGDIRYFGDVSGATMSEDSTTLCAVCRKP